MDAWVEGSDPPGGPRFICWCGQSVQASFYAQHVANAVAKDLIERCVRAEAVLSEGRGQFPILGSLSDEQQKSRLSGKVEGVSLVRSYIEEIPRG
jgi:hypothetical protein